MANYLINITDANQIVPSVCEAAARANEQSYVFLIHNEDNNIIRGPSEILNPSDEFPIYRRPDGGGSWYHNNTKCAMLIDPEPCCPNKWTDKLEEVLAKTAPGEYRTGATRAQHQDIYSKNGTMQQIMGTSLWMTKNSENKPVVVYRACWYEEDPMEGISKMLEHDGIDVDDFKSKVGHLDEAVFKYLLEKYSPKFCEASDFISDRSAKLAQSYQERNGGRKINPCVLSGFPTE